MSLLNVAAPAGCRDTPGAVRVREWVCVCVYVCAWVRAGR